MAVAKTFKDIYKDIFTKQIPEKWGAAISAPGKVMTAGLGVAAPTLATPMVYKTFRDTAGMDQKQALTATLQHNTEMQKQFVGDALQGDLVREPVRQVAQSNISKPAKFGAIAALKGAELVSQIPAYQAIGTVAQGAKNWNIKNSPIPQKILDNEKKHAIDQLVGHPDTTMYFPQNKPAAEALSMAIDKSRGVPLKNFGQEVVKNMPAKYMKDPNVATAVNNWVGNTNNMYQGIRMGINSGMSFGQASWLGDKLRNVDKAYTPYLFNLIENLRPKSKK